MKPPHPDDALSFDEAEAADVDATLRTFPLPLPRDMPRVWSTPDGHFYLMDSVPLGSETWRWRTNWSSHLTNALHDAGWAVTKQRRYTR